MKRALLGTNRPIRTEAKGFAYTITPHTENSNQRKAVTIILVVLWGAMTLGSQAGFNPPETAYGTLTAFVFWRIGKIQEQEAERVDSEDSK